MSLLATRCFQEALSEVVLSLVARGAHGSAIAQWRAAASPRFILRAICGKKIHRDPQNRGRVIVFRGFVFCSAHLEFHEMSSALFFSDVFSCSIFFWFLKIASDVFFSVCIFFLVDTVTLAKTQPAATPRPPCSRGRRAPSPHPPTHTNQAGSL